MANAHYTHPSVQQGLHDLQTLLLVYHGLRQGVGDSRSLDLEGRHLDLEKRAGWRLGQAGDEATGYQVREEKSSRRRDEKEMGSGRDGVEMVPERRRGRHDARTKST